MTTDRKVVLVCGSSPLFGELKELAGASGYEVVHLDRLEEVKERIVAEVEVNNLSLEDKRDAIVKLDASLPPTVPILSTSLAVTATEIASWAQSPQRICGFGTLVPLAERELFELAAALQTEDSVMEQANAFVRSLGKDAVVVQDEVGLVFPRIVSLIINEAVFAVMEKTAVPKDIDTAMKKGTNYPFGPLEWADRIGLGEVFAIIRGLYRDMGEERYRPAPLLRKLVLAGRFGQSSGQGFYIYDEREGDPI